MVRYDDDFPRLLVDELNIFREDPERKRHRLTSFQSKLSGERATGFFLKRTTDY